MELVIQSQQLVNSKRNRILPLSIATDGSSGAMATIARTVTGSGGGVARTATSPRAAAGALLLAAHSTAGIGMAPDDDVPSHLASPEPKYSLLLSLVLLPHSP